MNVLSLHTSSRLAATRAFRPRWARWILVVVLGSCAWPAFAKPTAEEVRILTTPGGVEYGTWGGAEGRPSPTLIVLTGNLMDSFTKGNFLRAGNVLGPRGYLCVSVDLPDHGKLASKEYRGVPGWAKRLGEGDGGFVAESNARLKQVVDHLIAEGRTDPDKLVVSGTSRGGFLALHYAASDPRVDAVVAYAPAIDLSKVTKYFAEVREAPATRAVNVMNLVPQLVGRPVLIFMGDRDAAVDTDTAIAFTRALSAAALKAEAPSQVELHVVSEPRGHALPGDLAIPAARWIYRRMEGKELTNL